MNTRDSFAGDRCWIGDSQGQIGCLDLKIGKVQASLKGAAGSVRSLTVHEEADIIISAGLDRYLRLHSLGTRKPIARCALSLFDCDFVLDCYCILDTSGQASKYSYSSTPDQ